MRNYFYTVVSGRQNGVAAKIIRLFLTILSAFYYPLVCLRNFIYDRKPGLSLSKPTISVGNITWGGVGKTPFVILLAKYVLAQGFVPAILTRGYMAKFGVSDEAELFKKEIPGIIVGVGADRVMAARKILAKRAVDVFILDDGFQHRRVKRHLDIVLVDAGNPFGNGALIPGGILREPLSAFKRADAVVLTKTDLYSQDAKRLNDQLKKIKPFLSIAWAVHQPQDFSLLSGPKKLLSELKGVSAVSFCSIGDPESFKLTLQKVGLNLLDQVEFPDHHMYCKEEILKVISRAQESGAKVIVTTAKDAVKLGPFRELFGSVSCLILNINFEIEAGKGEIFGRIDHLLGR